ncbi:hypothetical protein ABZ630_34275, partial [Streptomyces albidoflavus]|uniref:hypothetical protein n=1 Tax=Streptomyces albidoflavus TaxID=1886 RepID=UPI0033D5D4FD
TVEVCIQRRLGFEKALFAELPEARIVTNQQGMVNGPDRTIGGCSLCCTPRPCTSRSSTPCGTGSGPA